MLFSQDIQHRIHDGFMANIQNLGSQKDNILASLKSCSPDEQTVMEFYYSSMPASDIADLEFSLLLEYARFSIYLKNNSLWQLPEDIFFNYVAHYRINNEDISSCRALFYNELSSLVKDLSMEEAALRINVWCAGHMTYRLTDERTVSPLTAFRSAFGRCGEESTFGVAALRSVGIPARQVYTPRWAHCDDNHAWVEVWCDGVWHFLGACEPEPVLDKGWFNDAAARGMLFHSKVFSVLDHEEIVSKQGQMLVLNQTHRYAPSRKFTVSVTDKGKPLQGVTVHFQLINMSESFSIATTLTDRLGKSTITLGCGSIIVRAVKDTLFIEKIVHTGEIDNLELDFENALTTQPEVTSTFTMHAPIDISANSLPLTKEQKSQRTATLAKADAQRGVYASSFFDKTKSENFSHSPLAIDILKESQGNFNEIYSFLYEEKYSLELKLDLLGSLTKKDYRDVKSKLLLDHLKESLPYIYSFPREVFISYLLCPRISLETLSPYRKFILEHFTGEQKNFFTSAPHKLWDYIEKNFHCPYQENIGLLTTPIGSLSSGLADPASKKILFVAICRTFGIPSRLNPINFAPEYYRDNRFIGVEVDLPASDCSLKLFGGNTNWLYLQNWSLGVLENGVYKTLSLDNIPWSDQELIVPLIQGNYRLLTTNRMPNGNILVKKFVFNMHKGKEKTLEISLHQADIKDMLGSIMFQPFELSENCQTLDLDKTLTNKTSILIFLEPGREPTEHILNELLECKTINDLECQILFILDPSSNHQDPTFLRAITALQGVKVCSADFSTVIESMGRRMFVDPEKLPLTVVAKNGCNGVYSTSGYNVGLVELLVKIVNGIKEN